MFPDVDAASFVRGMGDHFGQFKLLGIREGSKTHCVVDLEQSGREFAHSVVVGWDGRYNILRAYIQKETLILKEHYAWLLDYLAEYVNTSESTVASRFAVVKVEPKHVFLSLDVSWTTWVPTPERMSKRRLRSLRSTVKEHIALVTEEAELSVEHLNERFGKIMIH